MQNPRFVLIDSLRAIAALSVFFAHAAIVLRSIGGASFSPFLARLDIGVAIFLVISAFLLYRPFAQARLSGSRRPRVGPFAIRRALRILPAYWVAAVLVAVLIGAREFFEPEGRVTIGGIITYFGLLQVYSEDTIVGGIGQAWTVGVEATFYLLLPVWAVFARRSPPRSEHHFLVTELAPLAVMFAAGVAWKIGVFEQTAAGTTKLTPGIYSLPAFLDFFALGMALAVLSVVVSAREHKPAAVRAIEARSWPWWGIAAIAFWLSGVVADALGQVSNSEFLARHLLNAVAAIGLLLPVIWHGPGTGAGFLRRRIMANRALLWLGATSYAFYLYHLAFLLELNEAGVPDAIGGAGFVVLVFALSLAAGAVSWYGLERYALRLGRRLARGQVTAGSELERRDLEEPPPPVPDTAPVPEPEPERARR